MIDKYVNQNSLDRVDVVKLDIEGAEYHALKGMKNVLAEFSPELYVEINPGRLRSVGTSALEVCQFLSDFGYKPYYLNGYHKQLIADPVQMKPTSLILFTKERRL